MTISVTYLASSKNANNGGSRFTSIHNVSQQSQVLKQESSIASMLNGDNTSIAEAAGFLSNLRYLDLPDQEFFVEV